MSMSPESRPPPDDRKKVESGSVPVVYDGTNLPYVCRSIEEAIGVHGQDSAKGSIIIKNSLHPDYQPDPQS